MPPFKTIASLLLHQAKEQGEKIAFSGQDRTITYEKLEKRTRYLASHLIEDSAIKRRRSVAIVLGRCLEAIESVLAITRAGAVGVPLDPRSSPTELSSTLAHCDARVVITESRYLTTVRSAAGKGVLIVAVTPNSEEENVVYYEDWATVPKEETGNGNLDQLGGDEETFLHCTSGTTGAPKGILSSQASWLWSAASFVTAFGLTSEDSLFWPLPLFHCLGHSLCILSTLTAGASAHLAPPDEPLSQSLVERAATTTMIVGAPATFYELLTAAETSKTTLALPRLRACMSAGAPAPLSLRTQVRKVFGAPLLNNYGCTEACGAIAIQNPCGVGACDEESSGVPLPGIEVRLVDVVSGDWVQDAETEGEIWVRSPSLMLRYCRNDQSPFEAGGWFRTGDMACWVASTKAGAQELKLVGRRKELIIRGGENIHPEELERVLLQCPGVADVVVTAASHRLLGETPVAFIVNETPGCGVDPMTLLSACRELLCDHKTPTAFYEIDAVPRTLLGKPRRAAVKNCTNRPLTARHTLLSRDAIAALVDAEVAGACGARQGDTSWSRHSGDQPFTFLGLTSLAGVVLRDRLCSLTGLDLPATLVFEHPTPDALVEYLHHRLLGHEIPPNLPESEPQPATKPNELTGAEPIAIVSMACRYPGGITSSDDLWRIVTEELDVTSEFPTNRGWDLEALYSPDPDAPGTSTTQRGAFLHDMADFDAGLFGMSPREALATDPQQRLLLETTWDLIERGRMAPSALRGSETGVFVGSLYDDYEENGQGHHELEAHLTLGSSGSVVTGRISYCFGFHGPSLCIQTGCSSSLVAVHLAASSLRNRECSLAIAGGVTTMATPRPFIFFSKRRGLSPDGRCRAYSSDANGTGWGEGVGLLLLERLADAQRNGHQVLGVLRGSAVNSDGAASNGLTAPSGKAQQAVIRQALAQAGLKPGDVDVVEGHGTATPLGDPIEVNALIAAYGRDDREGHSASLPLLLGSIKSNIGHTQAAAGVAGIIKMVQAMNHGIAPATLHVTKPSRQIQWHGSGVELLTKPRPWPQHLSRDGEQLKPRRAAVSSLGIGGTNSHVILEQAPPHHSASKSEDSAEEKKASAFPWLVSGADEAALRAKARSLLPLAEKATEKEAVNIAFSLATTRSALQHRAAVFPPSLSGLMALAHGQLHPDLVTSATKGRVAFLFSGQGSRSAISPSVLHELSVAFPTFSCSFQEACDELDRHLECPLQTALSSPMGSRTDFAQASLFAFEVAMFRLLESFNIRPDAMTGHSLGEIIAAHVAGYLSLHEAAMIVATRGRLMAALPGNGSMVSLSATQDEVTAELATRCYEAGTVTIAAINSPNAVVVSGTKDAVTTVADRFRSLGRRVKILPNVNHAFHSPLMVPILEDLGRLLVASMSEISDRKLTTIPLVSSVTGTRIEAEALRSPKHWVQHVREPVRFADALQTLQQGERSSVFLEVGPSAVLAPHVSGHNTVVGTTGSTVDKLLAAVGQLWARGVPVDWQAVFQGSGARAVDLPVYAFQRRRYWLDPPRRSSSCVLTPSSSSPSTSTPSCETDDTCHGEMNAAETWLNELIRVSPENHHDVLLDLLRAEVAAVLGFSGRQDVPERSLAELGFDSFTSALLTNRLRALTGIQSLPVTLALDCDDLPAVVQYVAARLHEPESQPFQLSRAPKSADSIANGHHAQRNGSNTPSSGIVHSKCGPTGPDLLQGLAALHKRLCQLGQYTAAAGLLVSASAVLPTFTFQSGGSLSSIRAVTPQHLTTGHPGASTLPLVCIAPFFPPVVIEGTSMGSVYSFLASEMRGKRDVFELHHPEGPAIPADLDTLAAVHAATIREHFGDDGPILLAGYSAGGVVAHAVASKLGPKQVAGLILIDTYLDMKRDAPDWLHALPGEALIARAAGGFDGVALARVGGYFKLLEQQLMELPSDVATLFLRALHPSQNMPKDGWRASWLRADRVVDVPGSHLEMLEKRHAPAVVEEIQRWVRGCAGELGAG